MATSKLKSTLSAAALAASALTLPGVAQAAVYAGQFDPIYGSPFTNLGWEGVIKFSVPDACVLALGNAAGVLTSFSCAGMSVLSAVVDLYDTVPTNQVAQLNFAPASMALLSLSLGAGAPSLKLPTAAQTSLSTPVVNSATFENIDDYAFSLRSFTEGVRLFHTALSIPTAQPGDCGSANFAQCGWGSVGNNDGKVPFAFTIQTAPVPEPATLVLLLAGLGVVLGVGMRRKSQA